MPLLTVAEGDAVLDMAFGGYSVAGKKARNEDAFAVHQPPIGERTFKGVVACIADGVSCSDNAQLASQTAVTDFIQNYYSTADSWSVKHSAAKVLTALNNWLFHHGQQVSNRHNGLVTTFTTLICKSTTGYVFHCGDSRLYRLRDGQLELLTRDHTHTQQGGRSFLTRALGMDSHLEVDYVELDLNVDDVLLLTTDGVHGFLRDPELLQLLQSSTENLETLSKTIVESALTADSDDNVSCLLLKVKQLPVAALDEVHRKLTELVIPPALQPGQKIDGYEVVGILHSGTRSHVYRVVNAEGKVFVLKAPSPNFADDAQYLEGFYREQWVGQKVNHPAIMKIYPRAKDSPFLYHLCEFIEGTTLRQWMVDNPLPPLHKVREITSAMVRAIRVFQRLGMVHRDIKPENWILDGRGQLRLIDFGTVQVDSLDEISSPLGEDVPVGSVDYIAPEYLQGGKGRHESDIFSIGVIIYEMCTGHLPFKETAAKQNDPQRYLSWEYIPARHWRPELPLWLDLALQKACEPNPAHRYHVMSELEHDLNNPRESLIEIHQSSPLLQRNPVLFWQCVAAVLLMIVMIQWFWLAT